MSHEIVMGYDWGLIVCCLPTVHVSINTIVMGYDWVLIVCCLTTVHVSINAIFGFMFVSFYILLYLCLLVVNIIYFLKAGTFIEK